MKTFQSLKGHFLLDSGQLRGSYFERSVILMCQHDKEGAFGLVINRPTSSRLEDGVSTDVSESVGHLRVYEGGPVQSSVFTYLHADQLILNPNVMPNLNLGHSIESLSELGASYSATQQIKVFAGYSGWGGGQLEGELENKAWITCPADLERVFHDDPDNLWRNILRDLGWEKRLLADSPDDLSFN